jgi:hypothetical protein
MHHASTSPTAALAMAIFDNAREHRECRNGYRGAEEEHERYLADMMTARDSVVAIEPDCQCHSDAEGQCHGGHRDRENRLALPPGLSRVHFPADQEHEQQDAHLRYGGQIAALGQREEPRR